MALAFFVSSTGDTNLALETIYSLKMKQIKKYDKKIIVIPLTQTAKKLAGEFQQKFPASFDLNISPILTSAENVPALMEQHCVEQAYIGVPSVVSEDLPFKIANALTIPFFMAYEHMFKAANEHVLWQHTAELANNPLCTMVVPTALALNDFPGGKKEVIGHLGIDYVLQNADQDTTATREALQIKKNEKLVFISGTTQPPNVDLEFLEALLKELVSGNHPNMQCRFGIHPGVADIENYLQSLLKLCEKYPAASEYFKFIITPAIKDKLINKALVNNPFILEANIGGPAATEAADSVAQAVPGELLVRSALKGKPVLSSKDSYLPNIRFNISSAVFFRANKSKRLANYSELGMEEVAAPDRLAKLF